jgi:hypothetical protein
MFQGPRSRVERKWVLSDASGGVDSADVESLRGRLYRAENRINASKAEYEYYRTHAEQLIAEKEEENSKRYDQMQRLLHERSSLKATVSDLTDKNRKLEALLTGNSSIDSDVLDGAVKADAEINPALCAVCLSPYKANDDTFMTTQCRHVIHGHCLREYKRLNDRKLTMRCHCCRRESVIYIKIHL